MNEDRARGRTRLRLGRARVRRSREAREARQGRAGQGRKEREAGSMGTLISSRNSKCDRRMEDSRMLSTELESLHYTFLPSCHNCKQT